MARTRLDIKKNRQIDDQKKPERRRRTKQNNNKKTSARHDIIVEQTAGRCETCGGGGGNDDDFKFGCFVCNVTVKSYSSQQRRTYHRNDGCSATAAEITGRRRRRSYRDTDVARFIHLSCLRRRGQVADTGPVPIDAARCLVGVARNRWRRRRLVRFFKFFFLLLVARETAAADASPPRKLVVDTSPLLVSTYSSPTLFDRFI